MNCIDDIIDQYEISIECLKEQIQKDQCLVNCINAEIEIKKPIEQFLKNHADYVSSSEEVANQKGVVSSLGLTTPARRATVNVEHQIRAETQAVQSGAGLVNGHYHLITINFPRDQKFRLNKKMNYKYNDYKTNEQRIICNRVQHIFDDWQLQYNIYYEYCKDGNLHIHCILKDSPQTPRDIKIDINRFYGVNNSYFCDVRPIEDLKKVEEYLTNKKEKAYQTTGIPPIIKII